MPFSSDDPPEVVSRFTGHELWINDVAWSPDRRYLASASADTTVRIWDVVDGRTIQELSAFHGSVNEVAWSPDGRSLVTASSEPSAQLKVWSTDDWQIIRSRNPTEDVVSISWSPDGRRLAYGVQDSQANGTVVVWDVLSNVVESQVYVSAGAASIAWSPSSDKLAVSSLVKEPTGDRDKVLFWKVNDHNLEQVPLVLDGHPEIITSIAWSPDGKFIATGAHDNSAKIWDASSGRNVRTFTHDADVMSVAWSPDGTQLASGSWDLTAKVWDVTTGANIATFKHHNYVNTVAWSQDGKLLATGDHDAVVRLWRVK